MKVRKGGDLGHIEEVEIIGRFAWYGVRLLTPDNEPSVCVTWTDRVEPVSDNVVPLPRSKEWWAESRAFCAAVEAALHDHFNEGGES